MEILVNLLILVQAAYPGWQASARSGGAGGAQEATGSARGGAAGAPESQNMLGMLPVLSLAICMAIGGP